MTYIANFYSEHLTFMECLHFRSHMLMDIESVEKANVGDKTLTTNEEEDCVTINKIYSYMHNKHIFSVFLNIEITMRIFFSVITPAVNVHFLK